MVLLLELVRLSAWVLSWLADRRNEVLHC